MKKPAGRSKCVDRLVAAAGGAIFLFCLLFAAGCGTGLVSSEGSFVPEAARIPLVEGERRSGQWQTRDLVLDYRQRKTQSSMEISGSFHFKNRIHYNFRTIDHFHLRAYLLDARGKVLDTQGLVSMSGGDPERTFSFQAAFGLPPGASAIALGYTGKVFGNDRGGSPTPFWHYPTTTRGEASSTSR